jgi:hypothetical protein
VATHVPSQPSGGFDGVPAPLPGQLVVFAVNLPGSKQGLVEGPQAHGGEHVTEAGGVSR